MRIRGHGAGSRRRAPWWMAALASLLGLPAVLPVAAAEQALPRELEGVGIKEKLGAEVDLDLTFIGENGYPVALRDYFGRGRPVILNLVYYNCPMLCNLVLNGQTTALRELPWTPGEEFEVVTISIDPTETFALAQKKKALYLTNYERPAPGWHFLTDHQGNVKRLADQIGFNYKYDESQRQYAHAAAIMILTEKGVVSRYLYGIRFKLRDLRLALAEASDGRVGGISERVLLFCFHYDPSSKSYVPFATNMMRAGGVLVVLILSFFLLRLWRRERVRTAGDSLVSAQ